MPQSTHKRHTAVVDTAQRPRPRPCVNTPSVGRRGRVVVAVAVVSPPAYAMRLQSPRTGGLPGGLACGLAWAAAHGERTTDEAGLAKEHMGLNPGNKE